jgi:hypothetical protein
MNRSKQHIFWKDDNILIISASIDAGALINSKSVKNLYGITFVFGKFKNNYDQ